MRGVAGMSMTNIQIAAAVIFGGPFAIAALVGFPAAFSSRYRRLLHRHLIG